MERSATTAQNFAATRLAALQTPAQGGISAATPFEPYPFHHP